MNSTFKITIDDGYGKYLYEYSLSEDLSIYDIAKTIADKYGVPMQEGKFIPDKRIDEKLYGPSQQVPA